MRPRESLDLSDLSIIGPVGAAVAALTEPFEDAIVADVSPTKTARFYSFCG
jgi:hypothetical protein